MAQEIELNWKELKREGLLCWYAIIEGLDVGYTIVEFDDSYSLIASSIYRPLGKIGYYTTLGKARKEALKHLLGLIKKEEAVKVRKAAALAGRPQIVWMLNEERGTFFGDPGIENCYVYILAMDGPNRYSLSATNGIGLIAKTKTVDEGKEKAQAHLDQLYRNQAEAICKS